MEPLDLGQKRGITKLHEIHETGDTGNLPKRRGCLLLRDADLLLSLGHLWVRILNQSIRAQNRVRLIVAEFFARVQLWEEEMVPGFLYAPKGEQLHLGLEKGEEIHGKKNVSTKALRCSTPPE